MRITVAIPSRQRPAFLREAILSLHVRASGKHQVVYVVGADADDYKTAGMGYSLRMNGVPVVVHCAVRGPSLGQMVNDIAEAYPADVYCSLCDDVLIQTAGWDDVIAQAVAARPAGVWWWQCPTNATYAVVSEGWRKAAGRIFTDYFAYWWDDVWLCAVWKYATGEKLLMLNAGLKDRGPHTHRMRDLQCWTDFFWSRGPERRAEARKIARTLGLPPVRIDPKEMLRSNPTFVASIPSIEAGQGERGPPTPEYRKAFARIESMMRAA